MVLSSAPPDEPYIVSEYETDNMYGHTRTITWKASPETVDSGEVVGDSENLGLWR